MFLHGSFAWMHPLAAKLPHEALYACLPVCHWVAFPARCGLDFKRTKEEHTLSPVNTEQRDAPSFTAE
jgi:hypothetical protein